MIKMDGVIWTAREGYQEEQWGMKCVIMYMAVTATPTCKPTGVCKQ